MAGHDRLWRVSSNQLTTVTLPASIEWIHNKAFAYDTDLAAFLLEGPVPTGSESIFTSSPLSPRSCIDRSTPTPRPGLANRPERLLDPPGPRLGSSPHRVTPQRR